MLAGSRVALKLHRIEVGLASLLALGVAAFAFLVDNAALASVDAWLWTTLAVMPFVVGLIVGVPIVSRELEGRTAQLAWSLNGSRTGWLLRQGVPVFLATSVAVALMALSGQALVMRPNIHPEAPFVNIGSYGLPVVARTFAAFGVGMFLGTLLGRALPALVVGVVLALFVLFSSTGMRGAWLASQRPLVPLTDQVGFIQAGWAILAPDGTQLTVEDARALAPRDLRPDPWLEEHGYSWLPLGLPLEVATGWIWYDTGIFVVVGSLAAGAAAVLTNRRRPT